MGTPAGAQSACVRVIVRSGISCVISLPALISSLLNAVRGGFDFCINMLQQITIFLSSRACSQAGGHGYGAQVSRSHEEETPAAANACITLPPINQINAI